jgi:hypothetical protein
MTMSNALPNTSRVSLATTAALWVFCVVFVERRLRGWQRLIVGTLHFACHLLSAICLLVVIELILEAGRSGWLGTSALPSQSRLRPKAHSCLGTFLPRPRHFPLARLVVSHFD